MATPGQAIRDALAPLGFAVMGDQLAQALEGHFSADSKPLPDDMASIATAIEDQVHFLRWHSWHSTPRDALLRTAALAIKGLLLMVKQGV